MSPQTPDSPAVPDWVLRHLTRTQWRFVNAYLGPARFNATKAAWLIGFRNKTTVRVHGHRLYTHVNVQAEIARRLEAEVMDRHEVMARLREQVQTGLTALRDCFVTQKDGRRTLDLDKVHRLGYGHLIRKITPTKYGDSVEMYDGQTALIRLGMKHGLFADKLITAEDVDVTKLSDEKLAELRSKYAKNSRN
jgi:hypothetical protein